MLANSNPTESRFIEVLDSKLLSGLQGPVHCLLDFNRRDSASYIRA